MIAVQTNVRNNQQQIVWRPPLLYTPYEVKCKIMYLEVDRCETPSPPGGVNSAPRGPRIQDKEAKKQGDMPPTRSKTSIPTSPQEQFKYDSERGGRENKPNCSRFLVLWNMPTAFPPFQNKRNQAFFTAQTANFRHFHASTRVQTFTIPTTPD